MKQKKLGLIILLLAVCSVVTLVVAQNYNLKNDYAVEGYDVVSYFTNGEPLKGKTEYTHIHNKVKYKFASEENVAIFKKEPSKYIPQYGGWCAYAMGKNGEKVGVNPKTFEIGEDGKLYLFYNKFGTNTLKLWNNENPQKLKKAADKYWGEQQ